MKERIQKVLATAGLGSRRQIEGWIAEGRVDVNGQTATLGQKIGPRDRVRVDGRSVSLPRHDEPIRVLAYKKRVGELVTRDDPEGRRTVFRKLPELEHGRWIAVGRLDINTSGLLLLTNSGELARRLMHPSYELEREYAVRVLGQVGPEVLDRLRRGVRLDDGVGRFDSIHVSGAKGGGYAEEAEDESAANQWFNVVVREGRNRLVRRLWESQGFQVSRLIRVRYGPVELGRGIRSGRARELDHKEIKGLLKAVGLDKPAKPGSK
ncbi:MAG: pseudouridine synthase [Gammaproteobacteria bacterium]|nr:pseudouridine synthase [Gammaproteobacteria bacterium]